MRRKTRKSGDQRTVGLTLKVSEKVALSIISAAVILAVALKFGPEAAALFAPSLGIGP
jgi:hypothetical protein